MTARRSRFFDQTVPFIKPTFAFLTATKPAQLASLNKLVGEFSLGVWLLVAIVLCVLSFGGRLITFFQLKLKEKNGKINTSEVIHALTVDTESKSTVRPSTVTQTTLIVLYIIAVTTFTAAYQGALLQTLVVNDVQMYSVDELIQMVSTGERQLVVESFGYYFTDEMDYAREMNDTTDMTLFARLVRATVNNPVIVNENGIDVVNGVSNNKYIYMHMAHWIEDILSIANYRTYDECNIFDLIHADDGSDHWLGLFLKVILFILILVMLLRRDDKRTMNILNEIILTVYGRLQTIADAESTNPDCAAALRSNWKPQVTHTHTHTHT